jgi:hypothetical protein
MTDDRRSAKSPKRAPDEAVLGRAEPIPASVWEQIDRLRGDAILVAPDDAPPEGVDF